MTTDDGVRARLTAALRAAMRAKDATALAAVRSALSALDNAAAVDAVGSASGATHARVAGTVAGVGAAEAERRTLSEQEQLDIVQAEIDERLSAATQFTLSSHGERADRLRAEAEVLAGCLTTADPTT